MNFAESIREVIESLVTRGRAMLQGDARERFARARRAQAGYGETEQLTQEPAWCHVNLRAADGTRIDVDYQIRGSYSRSGAFMATPMWINVKNDALGPCSRVRAVLMEVSRQHQVTRTQEIDLAYQECGRFSGQTTMSTTLNNFHELAVVIDGRWLRDPIGGTPNFRFNLGLGFEACRTPQ